jgi:predicted GH43/DUF377 family glycosyl hydrolase
MDLGKRLDENPILTPERVKPSVQGAMVECLLNPGIFRYRGRIGMLMRVAERMEQRDGFVSTLVADEAQENGVRVVEFSLDDPKLDYTDPRVFTYEDCP